MRIFVFTILFCIASSSMSFAAKLVIDGTSKESFELSAKAMADTLTDEKKGQFGRSLIAMLLSKYPPAAGAKGLVALSLIPKAMESAHIYLDGVSLSEIMTFKSATPLQEAENPDANHCGSNGSSRPVSILNWSIKPINANTNNLKITFKSHLKKPIRLIDASAGFKDALGERIASLAIERDTSVSPGEEFHHNGRWGQFTFERLLKLNPEDVIPYACVRAVIYTDGAKETFN